MGNLISSNKKKGPQITDVDRAILTLKTQRNKLNDQTKLLDARIERHAAVAAELVREKRKDRALLALKKKKLVEKQVQQLGALLLNIEDMISNIETTKQQNRLVQVLQQGNDALKQLQKEVTVEDVQKLLEDTEEAKAYQEEMSALLGQSLTDVDAEAVEAELDALESEVLQEEVEALPAAPTTVVPQVEAAKAKAQRVVAAATEEEEKEEPAQQQLQPMLAS